MLTFLVRTPITKKQVSVLMLVIFGAFILFALLIPFPIATARATEPTPTPVVTPATNPPSTNSNLLCHLERGLNCDIMNPLDLATSASTLRTNPTIGARRVPTYTLISITFDREMDSSTITQDSFYVSQALARVKGSIDYINIGRMAIFYPDIPLEPDTTYTATVTMDVRDLSGVPLQKELVWTFTTTPVEQAQLGSGSLSANASPPGSGMNIYFGDLHSHTGFSDGQGTPLDAFTMARANGLQFYAVTEHGFMLNDAEWQNVLTQANAATIDGQFVALPGFEYTHAKGHINVFGSDTYIQRDDPAYDSLAEFYTWLVNHPTAIGQFNHPSNANDFNFNDFLFNPAADQKMVLQELTTTDQFLLSLDSNWHLGTLKNRDTHYANWGCCPLMGLLAPSLTKNAILATLKARRTFFVSPDDSNLALMLQADGYWMGSAIPNNSSMVNFTITAYDPDPTGKPLRLKLYDNGFPVASTILPSAVWYNWSPTVSGALGHYYYAEAYYDGWNYAAYSSPIWVERSPIADANITQFVTPGVLVTLDGTKSRDPDGDVLVYQWSQDSGPVVGLTGPNSTQPTFTAPGVLGNVDFSLTVTDTGSLSDTDTITVTVTDKPILSISKTGPIKAELGELITYTLTVTNNGISDAIGVVVTDAVPVGASYISGGTLLPGNIVSWTLTSTLGANGGMAEVRFVVTATEGIINSDYRASCADCIPAIGPVIVHTNSEPLYLPIIRKNN